MKVRVIKSKQNNHYLIETMYVGGMIQPFQDSTHVEVTTQVKTSSTMEEIDDRPTYLIQVPFCYFRLP